MRTQRERTNRRRLPSGADVAAIERQSRRIRDPKPEIAAHAATHDAPTEETSRPGSPLHNSDAHAIRRLNDVLCPHNLVAIGPGIARDVDSVRDTVGEVGTA